MERWCSTPFDYQVQRWLKCQPSSYVTVIGEELVGKKSQNRFRYADLSRLTLLEAVYGLVPGRVLWYWIDSQVRTAILYLHWDDKY
jgi:hypothetical protein